MVPHLVTALSGPLLDLERKILEAMPAIERWFRLEWQEHTPPFYCSVDLRNAGFKLAPVDTNLFPGGFNNLPQEVLPLAVQAAMASIEKICPDAKNLLVIPERHTRNAFYLENVARLATDHAAGRTQHPLRHARREHPRPGDHRARRWPEDRAGTARAHAAASGPEELRSVLDPAQQRSLRRHSAVLENLHEQYLLPPLHAGWAVRRKSTHFSCYDDVAKKFSKLVEIDPWMVNPYFAHVEGVDYEARTGEEALAEAIDGVLKKIAKKYREYGISEKPYVVIKADAGTYGKGVMTVHDASEVAALTKRERAKMNDAKEGLQVHDVIVQEGVHTFERVENAVAEPVVYMIDRYVVGGFYRVHDSRERDQNLNAPGMHFVPLGFEHTALPDTHAKPGAAPPNRFYMYGVVARLGLLAASLELEKTDPEAIQV